MPRRARSGFVVAAGIAATLAALLSVPQAAAAPAAEARLRESLRVLSRAVGGTVGIAAVHVESGRVVEVGGQRPLALYSVFKLPVAVAILKLVEEGRLRWDQKVRITPAEVVPGSAENTALWREPTERTIRELLDLSIAHSDNTSSDKLLELAGGPGAVTRRLAALGLPGITIRRSVREFMAARSRPHENTASALELARLLSRLQKGEILRADTRQALFGPMAAATTGLQRIRAGVPAGTHVLDKTGSGPGASATNDVGIVTLPDGNHLAMAVLVSGSKRPVEVQEKLIADVTRAVYEGNLSGR
jgi:beta-lactamase class A